MLPKAFGKRWLLCELFYTEWGGQFEHQAHAQRTLTMVLPLVICIIFVILYLTYRDLADTLMMFLAVPGAVAGGAIFQHLLPKLGVDVTGNFSVAVWVGYIACFGLATETSIVMLVYLREAIQRRGGMEKIQSEEGGQGSGHRRGRSPPPAKAADGGDDDFSPHPDALGHWRRCRIHAPHGRADPRRHPRGRRGD